MLHNDELYDLHSSPNSIPVIKSRRIRWVRYVASMWDWKGAYRDLVRRPHGMRPFGRLRHRWEDKI
jgi:hypothetical protein